MKILSLLFLRAYQILPSPLIEMIFKGGCRFTPSCSVYAKEAIEKYGFLAGGWLAVKRISHCRPFGPYGFDPVPRRTS